MSSAYASSLFGDPGDGAKGKPEDVDDLFASMGISRNGSAGGSESSHHQRPNGFPSAPPPDQDPYRLSIARPSQTERDSTASGASPAVKRKPPGANPFSSARLARASRSREPTLDAAASLFSAPAPVSRSNSHIGSSDSFFDAFGLSESKPKTSPTPATAKSSRVLDVLGFAVTPESSSKEPSIKSPKTTPEAPRDDRPASDRPIPAAEPVKSPKQAVDVLGFSTVTPAATPPQPSAKSPRPAQDPIGASATAPPAERIRSVDASQAQRLSPRSTPAVANTAPVKSPKPKEDDFFDSFGVNAGPPADRLKSPDALVQQGFQAPSPPVNKSPVVKSPPPVDSFFDSFGQSKPPAPPVAVARQPSSQVPPPPAVKSPPVKTPESHADSFFDSFGPPKPAPAPAPAPAPLAAKPPLQGFQPAPAVKSPPVKAPANEADSFFDSFGASKPAPPSSFGQSQQPPQTGFQAPPAVKSPPVNNADSFFDSFGASKPVPPPSQGPPQHGFQAPPPSAIKSPPVKSPAPDSFFDSFGAGKPAPTPPVEPSRSPQVLDVLGFGSAAPAGGEGSFFDSLKPVEQEVAPPPPAPAAAVPEPPRSGFYPAAPATKPVQGWLVPASLSDPFLALHVTPETGFKAPSVVQKSPAIVELAVERSRNLSATPVETVPSTDDNGVNPFEAGDGWDNEDNSISFIPAKDTSMSEEVVVNPSFSVPAPPVDVVPERPPSPPKAPQPVISPPQPVAAVTDDSMQEFEDIDTNPRKYGLFSTRKDGADASPRPAEAVVAPESRVDDLDDLVLGTVPATTHDFGAEVEQVMQDEFVQNLDAGVVVAEAQSDGEFWVFCVEKVLKLTAFFEGLGVSAAPLAFDTVQSSVVEDSLFGSSTNDANSGFDWSALGQAQASTGYAAPDHSVQSSWPAEPSFDTTAAGTTISAVADEPQDAYATQSGFDWTPAASNDVSNVFDTSASSGFDWSNLGAAAGPADAAGVSADVASSADASKAYDGFENVQAFEGQQGVPASWNDAGMYGTNAATEAYDYSNEASYVAETGYQAGGQPEGYANPEEANEAAGAYQQGSGYQTYDNSWGYYGDGANAGAEFNQVDQYPQDGQYGVTAEAGAADPSGGYDYTSYGQTAGTEAQDPNQYLQQTGDSGLNAAVDYATQQAAGDAYASYDGYQTGGQYGDTVADAGVTQTGLDASFGYGAESGDKTAEAVAADGSNQYGYGYEGQYGNYDYGVSQEQQQQQPEVAESSYANATFSHTNDAAAGAAAPWDASQYNSSEHVDLGHAGTDFSNQVDAFGGAAQQYDYSTHAAQDQQPNVSDTDFGAQQQQLDVGVADYGVSNTAVDFGGQSGAPVESQPAFSEPVAVAPSGFGHVESHAPVVEASKPPPIPYPAAPPRNVPQPESVPPPPANAAIRKPSAGAPPVPNAESYPVYPSYGPNPTQQQPLVQGGRESVDVGAGISLAKQPSRGTQPPPPPMGREFGSASGVPMSNQPSYGARQSEAYGQDMYSETRSQHSMRSPTYKQEDWMQCPNCTKRIEVDSVFCNKCGVKVADYQTPAVPPAPAPVQQAPPPPANSYQQQVHDVPVAVGQNDYAQPDYAQAAMGSSAYPQYGGSAGYAMPQGYGAEHIPSPHAHPAAPQEAPYQPVAPAAPPVSRSVYAVNDPLGRDRGHALAIWGLGGNLITTRPRRVQRLMTNQQTGQSIMQEKSFAGPIQMLPVQSLLVQSDLVQNVPRFPGPLLGAKVKLKKKDVIKLCEDGEKDARGRLERMQGLDAVAVAEAQSSVILWKLLIVLLESNGSFSFAKDDLSKIQAALMFEADKSDDTGSELRRLLMSGDRSKACQLCVSHRLWTHALIIAAQVDKDTYKNAVLNFVDAELQPREDENSGRAPVVQSPSMSVLYSVFSGAGRTSAQQLFYESDPTDESLQRGLKGWKETILMILANRTPGDLAVVSEIGDMFIKYNMPNTAHVCYLLTGNYSLISGLDDETAKVVLLGAQPGRTRSFALNFDALHITEVLEYAQSLRDGVGISNCLPHLQAYKLCYALWLADYGFNDLATKYCDAMELLSKSYSKGTGYFHKVYGGTLRELQERLAFAQNKAAPEVKESGGWFGKVARFDSLKSAFDRSITRLVGSALGDDVIAADGADTQGAQKNMIRTSSTPSEALKADRFGSDFGVADNYMAPQMTRPSSTPATVLTSPQAIYTTDSGANSYGVQYEADGSQYAAQQDQYMQYNQSGDYQMHGDPSQYDRYSPAHYGQHVDSTQAYPSYQEGETAYQDKYYAGGQAQYYGESADQGEQMQYNSYSDNANGNAVNDYGYAHGNGYSEDVGYSQQTFDSRQTPTFGFSDPQSLPPATSPIPRVTPTNDRVPSPAKGEGSLQTQDMPDQTHDDVDDDLGLGNSGLKKKKDKEEDTGEKAAGDAAPAADKRDSTSSGRSSGLFSFIPSIPFFGGKKDEKSASNSNLAAKKAEKPTKADLGEKLSLVYDPVKKCYCSSSTYEHQLECTSEPTYVAGSSRTKN
ncbi:vesicle coat component [Phlyctochytrium bullatum]|nr:vesicle coat component [Phlyctochytrium bullatum]